MRVDLCAHYTQIATQNNDEIPRIVEHVVLAMRADPQPNARTRLAFRTCDTVTTTKEIAEIRERALGLAQRMINPRSLTNKSLHKLAERLETLHKPTIEALANSRTAIDVGALRIKFPQTLRQASFDAPALIETLRIVTEACDGAMVVETSDEGRSQHRRDQVVARMLANAYATLTGKEPTLSVIGKAKSDATTRKVPFAGARIPRPKKELGPQGPFLDFVTTAFFAIGVQSDPWHMAKFAITDRKASRAKKRNP
ncbi:hypothetical protein [Rhodoblastus sp.]|uniref:hypothetical protein n=1 Tax=Rhodoblastus sp. TaxID=1962975 RepID=UPI003F9CD06D